MGEVRSIMPRPKGVKEESPRLKGGGRKPHISYADRYRDAPQGTATVTLHAVPLSTLEYIERLAKAEGLSVQEWIRKQLPQGKENDK